jgi:uncharacterized membrane protein HdeD (DUF308 family)
MKKIASIVLAVWAILIGGVALLTPNGIIIIVTNPAARIAIGVVSIVIGVFGFISSLAEKSTKG